MKAQDVEKFLRLTLKHSKLVHNSSLRPEQRGTQHLGGRTSVIPTFRLLREWKKLVNKSKRKKK